MTSGKLVVFDWNGTIIADTKMAWRASNLCLEFYGVPPISLQRQRETFDFPIIHYYKRNGVCIDKLLETKEKASEIFLNHYEMLAKNVRTRKHARSLLEWLRGHNISCIILSNYLTDKIKPQLERLNIDHFFQHISANNCDGTTVLNTTNKLERLSDYMTKRGYHPDHTVIIGDSMEEPDLARKLGITSFGITGGCITERRLCHAKPDHIVGNLNTVKEILGKKWQLPL